MTNSIELQVISRLINTDDQIERDRLCGFDSSYYSIFKDEIEFIFDHIDKTGKSPDNFTFLSNFPDFTFVEVNEPISYLESELKRNKQNILLLETFNRLSDLGSGDIEDAWEYLNRQCSLASELDNAKPLDIVKEAEARAATIIEYNKQLRIPTGFKQLDDVMYGGMSTVEDLILLVARTNAGKSWVCTRVMESAQSHGFPVLYYSPEMQSSFIGTRFDTWRGHFKNSELHKGQYSDDYKAYIKNLSSSNQCEALVVEDKDMSEGKTTVKALETLVKRHHIKLLILDGLSYIAPAAHMRYSNESTKYRDICNDLFKLSKTYGCAVFVAVQANRETKDNKDENGAPFPSVYNIAESDHPARIATQVFALRQMYEQHILELRLEKSRTAKNDKQTFAYSVDFNTGSMEFVSSAQVEEMLEMPQATFETPKVTAEISSHIESEDIVTVEDDEEDYADVEF